MENRYVLFHVALVLNILILIVSFTGVISSPAKASIIQKPNIIEVMKNDTNLCAASKCLYESEYAKLCASLPYPTVPLDFNEQNLNIFLCLGLYDTAYKICQYSSQISNTTILTLNLEKFVLNATFNAPLEKEKNFCVNLQGFTSSYNQIDSYLKTLIEMLKELNKCHKMCFDFDDKLKPLCAVFAWIKKYDDIKKANRTGTKHFVTNETSNKIEYKTIEANEMKESNEKKYRNNNKLILNISENSNVEKTSLNVTQTESTIPAELDVEKEKSDEKLNKAQKKLDTDLKTSAQKSSTLLDENKKKIINETETVKIVKPIKTILPIPPSDLQVSSMNNPISNVPKKDISKEKGEEFKEENSDDLKTSTLSENTQDYENTQDVKNLDGETNSIIEDTDKDTNEQSTGNQNENAESFKQENLQNPNIRTEDDSHFFTYFTVITVACIAGYIGYHNKQKILAIVLEGRRSRSNRSRRRPSTANYRKLDCTLEEAVTSQCNANVTHVIY